MSAYDDPLLYGCQGRYEPSPQPKERPMRDFNEMIRQLRTSGAIDPLQMEAAIALTAMRFALQRIADNRHNNNWRKPEICDEADRVLGDLS